MARRTASTCVLISASLFDFCHFSIFLLFFVHCFSFNFFFYFFLPAVCDGNMKNPIATATLCIYVNQIAVRLKLKLSMLLMLMTMPLPMLLIFFAFLYFCIFELRLLFDVLSHDVECCVLFVTSNVLFSKWNVSFVGFSFTNSN